MRFTSASLIALFLAFSLPGDAAPVTVGDSQASVLETLGTPLRQEQSTHGSLLIYPDSLVLIVEDKVDFVSFGLNIAPAEDKPPASEADVSVHDDSQPLVSTAGDPELADGGGAAVPLPKARGQRSEAILSDPFFSKAAQQNQQELLAASRRSANLSAYWGQLRQQFARNSIFDDADGMTTLKSADGRPILAVGESQDPTREYLDVGIEESVEEDITPESPPGAADTP